MHFNMLIVMQGIGELSVCEIGDALRLERRLGLVSEALETVSISLLFSEGVAYLCRVCSLVIYVYGFMKIYG